MKSSHSFRSHPRGKAPIKLLSMAAVSILLLTVLAPMLFTDSEVSADYQQSVTYYPSLEDYNNGTNDVTIQYSGLAYAAYNPQYDESFKDQTGWEAENVESNGRISLSLEASTGIERTITVELEDSITITDVSDRQDPVWLQFIELIISEDGKKFNIQVNGLSSRIFNIWFDFKYDGYAGPEGDVGDGEFVDETKYVYEWNLSDREPVKPIGWLFSSRPDDE